VPTPRGVVGASERHARRIVSALMKRGVLISDSAAARAAAPCLSGGAGPRVGCLGCFPRRQSMQIPFEAPRLRTNRLQTIT